MQKDQWQLYQSLELISPIIGEPRKTSFPLSQPLTSLWRSLINRLTRQLNSSQQVNHLEQCLILEGTEGLTILPHDQWHFPSYFSGGMLLTSEPNIWPTINDRGQKRWHIYDPRTGKIMDWETEDEVRTWLENRYQ